MSEGREVVKSSSKVASAEPTVKAGQQLVVSSSPQIPTREDLLAEGRNKVQSKTGHLLRINGQEIEALKINLPSSAAVPVANETIEQRLADLF